MPVSPEYNDKNRAATARIREFARLGDDVLLTPVGEHWTVAIVLAHIAFWDARVLMVLDKTEQEGKLFEYKTDILVNDYILPLLRVIPPQKAGQVAVETAERLDKRLEDFPPELLEEVNAFNQRFENRWMHRTEHLDEAEAAIQQARARKAT